MSRPSLAPYNPEPVQRLLRQAAEQWPDETAIVDGDRRFTFAELDDCSGRFASALAAMGLGKGDIVGILSPNCAEFEIAFFGILKAGATVTTVNSGYREREIAYQLEASGAQALIVHHTLADAADLALAGSEQVRRRILIAQGAQSAPSFWSLIEAQDPPPPEPALDPYEDIAALPFSSGTTGLQKGVMLTHANLHTNVRQNLGRTGEEGVVRRGDVMLVHLPLFHIYGMTVLQLSAIAAGATQVMMGRFDMAEMLSLIAEHRVSVLYTVPPVCLGLTLTSLLDEYDVSSLRFLLSGPRAARRPSSNSTIVGHMLESGRLPGAMELRPPGLGSNHMMPLFIRIPVCGSITLAPKGESRVWVSVTTVPSRSAAPRWLVQEARSASVPAPMPRRRSA